MYSLDRKRRLRHQNYHLLGRLVKFSNNIIWSGPSLPKLVSVIRLWFRPYISCRRYVISVATEGESWYAPYCVEYVSTITHVFHRTNHLFLGFPRNPINFLPSRRVSFSSETPVCAINFSRPPVIQAQQLLCSEIPNFIANLLFQLTVLIWIKKKGEMNFNKNELQLVELFETITI